MSDPAWYLQRSKKNARLENFITEMQRLTLVHERDSHGEDVYRLSPGGTSSPKAEEKTEEKTEKQERPQAKSGKTQRDAKSPAPEKRAEDTNSTREKETPQQRPEAPSDGANTGQEADGEQGNHAP